MKTLQNNFTTTEQSKRLLELGVPAGSADCWRQSPTSDIFVRCSEELHPEFFKGTTFIPCWSVGRLMEIIAECYQVDMPFRYFVRGGMMDSLINTFIDLRGEIDFSKLNE